MIALTRSLLLVVACASLVLAGQWTIVDPNYITIGLGCSFQTPTNGYVAGSTGATVAHIKHTNNSGVNLTDVELDFTNAALLSITMSNATNGVAGGFGFFGLPCGAVTSTGSSWSKSGVEKELFCAFQGTAASADHKSLIMIGTFAQVKNMHGNGLVITSDSGAHWQVREWGMGTSARYASFPTSQLGFVSGGMWPADDSDFGNTDFTDERWDTQHLTRHVSITKDKMVFRGRRSAAASGFVGIIAKTTDGGQTFQVSLNLTGQGVYFNEIDFADANNGWAVCEGVDGNNEQIAYVYATTDGGSTWNKQFTFSGGSLVTVSMVSSTTGWIGGMDINTEEGAAFYTTDGGSTWTRQNAIEGFYFMQISAVDPNNAYAAGVTRIGLSSLARYH